MQTTATIISSRVIRQPRFKDYRTCPGFSLPARVRRFIETTDWDERYLCHKRIDQACLGVLIVSILYFVHILP
jgi:hypothetical protein